MKEFELTLKLRNNCLKARRLALGLTAKELALRVGISHGLYVAYETMAASPIGSPNGIRRESWFKDSALKLAAFHGCQIEDLWPNTVLAVKQPKVVAEIDADAALALAGYTESLQLPPAPDELLEVRETHEMLEKAIGTLSPYHRKVVTMWSNGHSLEEIARSVDVSRERVRQILRDDIRKLGRRIGDEEGNSP